MSGYSNSGWITQNYFENYSGLLKLWICHYPPNIAVMDFRHKWVFANRPIHVHVCLLPMTNHAIFSIKWILYKSFWKQKRMHASVNNYDQFYM